MIWRRFFGRPEKSEIAVSQKHISELHQLLFLEKQTTTDLLKRIEVLENILINQKGNVSGVVTKEVKEVTPKEKEILDFVKLKGRVTSTEVQEAMKYKHRVTASVMLSVLIKKGQVRRINQGRLSAYVLSGSALSV